MELQEAQAGLASIQEIFWDLNVPGDPAQLAKERLAEATLWNNFKTESNEARQRAAWLRLEREARVRLASLEQELLDREANLSRALKREISIKTDSARSVSSRLGPVNRSNKSGSACGSATPPPLTPAKKNKPGPQERKHIRLHQATRAPIGTPGVAKAEPKTEECPGPDLKARAEAKVDADTQVRSLATTLESRPVTLLDWEWDQIVTDDNLCKE
eukprot:1187073-Rhodomonas_salina.1